MYIIKYLSELLTVVQSILNALYKVYMLQWMTYSCLLMIAIDCSTVLEMLQSNFKFSSISHHLCIYTFI